MPFVPLGQRKPIPLVLDGDKEALQARQRERDGAAVQNHYGFAPGSHGYRFANHPQTFGLVRGPDMPFRNASAPWRPPSADPAGPASKRADEQAAYGALWEGSHGMRKVHSTPALESPSNVMQACHPLSTELRRWEHLAQRTQSIEMKDVSPPRKREPAPPPPKVGPNKQGLVLFPKYMLIHNCHLKMQDLQRFQREQAEEAARLAELAETEQQDAELGRAPEVGQDGMYAASRGPMFFEASWGAPKLKEQSVGGPHWAGSGMPAGRGQRTSNPFRMG